MAVSEHAASPVRPWAWTVALAAGLLLAVAGLNAWRLLDASPQEKPLNRSEASSPAPPRHPVMISSAGQPEPVPPPSRDDDLPRRGVLYVMGALLVLSLAGFGLRASFKAAEAQMQHRRALAEKEELLREIHHRVKNNLQIILSLVNLQSLMDAGTAQQNIESTCARVRSMALVHELLYRPGQPAGLTLSAYVPALSAQMARAFGRPEAELTLLGDRHLRLDLDRAVPVGMILCELLANAYSHAFRGDAPIRLRVAVRHQEDGLVLLRVKDNGPGLPEGFSLESCRTLGLQLVKTLAGQLGGRARAGGTTGARIDIAFPLAPKHPRPVHALDQGRPAQD